MTPTPEAVSGLLKRYGEDNPNTFVVKGGEGDVPRLIKNIEAEAVGISRDGTYADTAVIDNATPLSEIPEVVRYTMSTNNVDRVNDVFEPDGMNLNHFKRNAVALWNHNLNEPNIGRWQSLRVDPIPGTATRGLTGDLLFHRENDLSRELNRISVRGFLNACSVGLFPLEWKEMSKAEYLKERPGTFLYPYTDSVVIYTKSELFECSPCNVPMNPWALAQRDTAIRRAIDAGVIGVDSPAVSFLGDGSITTGLEYQSNLTNPKRMKPTEKNTEVVPTILRDLSEEIEQQEAEETVWKIHHALFKLEREAIESANEGDESLLDALPAQFTAAGEMIADTLRTAHAAKKSLDGVRKSLDALTKAGATLSKQNLTDIQGAFERLERVLSRATKEEDEAEKTADEATTLDELQAQVKTLTDREAENTATIKNLNDELARSAVEEEIDSSDEDEDIPIASLYD